MVLLCVGCETEFSSLCPLSPRGSSHRLNSCTLPLDPAGSFQLPHSLQSNGGSLA